METNSYQRLKDFVFTNLQKTKGALHETQIADEIANIRKLIDQVTIEVFAQFLHDKSKLTNLADAEWERLQKELELYFDVKMKAGVLIKGKEQQARDSTWWTGVEKQRVEKYYWSRYKTYIATLLNREVVSTLDTDTDIVMDNMENPAREGFDRYGMVVGHVQSGKTANYAALICKAADAGYKFIVVVAGGINNLRNQTQGRINEAFTGQNKGVPVGVGCLGGVRRELMPLSLTTEEQDFNNRDADRNAQGLNFDNINTPIILVIKKNVHTLTNVITWLEAQYKNQISKHALLMIDDESDYASINTKDEEDPTKINKLLRKLLSLFCKNAYVAYTATPYANIFIDHEAGHEDVGRDLFPRDFIYALDTPDNYFGARKIFLESNNRNIVSIDDHLEYFPDKHKKEHNIGSLPDSLYDAVRLFVLNVAIRHLRGQENFHNSMLVHATRYTRIHQQIAVFVQSYVDDLVKQINAYGKLESHEAQSQIIRDLRETFEERCPGLEFKWKQIFEKVCRIISTIVVREVHQSKSVKLEYRHDRTTNAIVIGGASLSRGFTLEGLSVSYFLRNTIFYDTLMQMGRWFGYRPGYEDLCRVYLPEAMIENFGLIIAATEDLIDDFKRMSKANMTPNDFGLCIKHHPESVMQITARNKQRSAKDIYFDMKLDGHAKETGYLIKDPKVRRDNLMAIDRLVEALEALPDIKREPVGKVHLWRNVKKNLVFDFMDAFQVPPGDPYGFRSRMPVEFIKKYVLDVDTSWDIALFNGSSDDLHTIAGLSIQKEERAVKVEEDRIVLNSRQVASGSAEGIVLSPDDRKRFGNDRKAIRAIMKRPLLMLHVLAPKILEQNINDMNELAAYGVSFPGGIESGGNNIRIKINTVYLQDFLKKEMDEESDD